MRYQGKIAVWNEERGFGFIDWNGGNDRIFVHISAFTARHKKPAVGDVVTYEAMKDEQGKLKAANVTFTRSSLAPDANRQRRRSTPLLPISAAVAVVAGGMFLFSKTDRPNQPQIESLSTPNTAPGTTETKRFRCEGKTHCSQMSSCEEATFYSQNCPDTEMDGDGDGVPCESQWCG